MFGVRGEQNEKVYNEEEEEEEMVPSVKENL